MDAGLLILRVVIGAVMAAHGAQKLFGWFGGGGPKGTAAWLESMGFKPGGLHAAVNGLAELGGGLLLIVGLLTPLAAAAVAGVMLVAIATVHLPHGFFNSSGGYEFNLTLIGAALALAFAGPGRWSLDRALEIDLAGTSWGLAAAGLAILAAGATLLLRREHAPGAQTSAA